MADLGNWIQRHANALIRSASETLAQDAAFQTRSVEAVGAFYDALLRACQSYDPTPLYTLLFDWVETRTGPLGESTGSLIPVLGRLKTITGEQILKLAAPDQAAPLYIEVDRIYTDAMVFLAAVEADDFKVTAQAELRKAETQIQRLNKSKSDFIAIAAHELKTPLTIIEGYAGMIRMSEAAAGDETLLLLSNGVESGIHRLRELVEDLIDVSVIELNLLRLNFQPVFLQHVLDSLETAIHDNIAERRQRLLIERDGIPQDALYADPERLVQALRKIVSNAIKYTPDGGTIALAARLSPGFVDLTVADNGVGIAASRLATIFDAFSSGGDVSLHSSGKVKFKGSGPGLGLPIAKGIIEAHGGSMWAQSPGYNEQTCPGSTFHIMLPLRAEPPDVMLNMYPENGLDVFGNLS